LFAAILARFVETSGSETVIREVLLDVVHSTTHTGVHCAAMVEEVLSKYGITLDRVASISCDNASSCDSMVAALQSTFRDKFPDSNRVIVPAYCFAHVIHRVVLFMMTPLNAALVEIRLAVKKTQQSGKMRQQLEKEIRKSTIDLGVVYTTRMVPLDVPTRWNSTWMMLEALLGLWVPFNNMLASCGHDPIEDSNLVAIRMYN
jgi:hypothetical protein